MFFLVHRGRLCPFLLFLIVLTQTMCNYGFYGHNCAQKCSESCDRLPNKELHCQKHTGDCSEGCIGGFHGFQCQRPCDVTCFSGICKKHNGDCIEVTPTRKPASSSVRIRSSSTITTTTITSSTSFKIAPSAEGTSMKSTSAFLLTQSTPPDTTSILNNQTPVLPGVDGGNNSFLFIGIIGTVIAILLFIIVLLFFVFLCRNHTASTERCNRRMEQLGNQPPIQPLEDPVLYSNRYWEIKEEDMDVELPVLAECFQEPELSENDSDFTLENPHYSHLLHNESMSDISITYIDPNNEDS